MTMVRPPEVLVIPPCFRVVRSDAPALAVDGEGDRSHTLVLRPGHAFGDGRHDTTQLCLQAIAHLSPRPPRPARPFRMLDVGSGSGILSLGAAKLGAVAVGVEIDAQANVLATDNARLSGVATRVRFVDSLAAVGEPPASFELVVANILRAVLLELAAPIVGFLAPGGTLVLSGLLATDVPEVSARYGSLLGERRPHIHQREEWRALVWRGR